MKVQYFIASTSEEFILACEKALLETPEERAPKDQLGR